MPTSSKRPRKAHVRVIASENPIPAPQMSVPSSRFLSLSRLPQVKARVGLSRPAIYARIAKGLFPRQIVISSNCVAWLDSEIDEWIAGQIASRDAAQ